MKRSIFVILYINTYLNLLLSLYCKQSIIISAAFLADSAAISLYIYNIYGDNIDDFDEAKTSSNDTIYILSDTSAFTIWIHRGSTQCSKPTISVLTIRVLYAYYARTTRVLPRSLLS